MTAKDPPTKARVKADEIGIRLQRNKQDEWSRKRRTAGNKSGGGGQHIVRGREKFHRFGSPRSCRVSTPSENLIVRRSARRPCLIGVAFGAPYHCTHRSDLFGHCPVRSISKKNGYCLQSNESARVCMDLRIFSICLMDLRSDQAPATDSISGSGVRSHPRNL